MSDVASFDERFQPFAQPSNTNTPPPWLTGAGAPAGQGPAPATAESSLSTQDPQLSPGADIARRALIEDEAAERRMRGLIEQQAANAKRREAAMEPRYKQMEDELNRPLPQQPQERPIPKAPTRQDAEGQDGNQVWLTAAMFLGVLGGALTRRPITNALSAFTGVVEGEHQAKTENYDRAMKTWEAANKEALEANAQSEREYERIMKNRQLSIEQKKVLMQLSAKRFDDQAMDIAAQMQGEEQIAKMRDQRTKYAEQLEKGLSQSKAEAGERFAQSPEGQARVQRIINYQEQAPSTALRNTEMGFRDAAIMDQVRRQAPATWSAGDFRVVNQERARRLSLYTRADEQQVQNQGTAINHLDTLANLQIQLKNGGVNALNALKQKIAQETGQPAPTSFDAASQLIGNEIVRAIVNNGGGVTDRQEVARNLNRSRSDEQTLGVIHTYQTLIAAQMAAKERQYNFSREGVPGAPSFEAAGHLTPKHLQLMREGQGFGEDPNQQRSQLQQNLDRIFGSVQGGATRVLGDVSGGAADVAEKPYWADVWERAKRKGWSLEPLDPNDQRTPLISRTRPQEN